MRGREHKMLTGKEEVSKCGISEMPVGTRQIANG
jgi:hypothetical protein